MSLDSLLYLLGLYWPFLVGALAVGVATGWFSASGPRGRSK